MSLDSGQGVFSFPREYPFFASKFVMYIDNVLSAVAICKFVLANAALRRIIDKSYETLTMKYLKCTTLSNILFESGSRYFIHAKHNKEHLFRDMIIFFFSLTF